MRDIRDYTTKDGFTVMANGDRGDAPMKTSMRAIGEFLNTDDAYIKSVVRNMYESTINTIEIQPGIYVRQQSEPWNDPADFSRDQTRGIVIACGHMGLQDRLSRLFWATIKRGCRYGNGDLMSPANLGEFIRAMKLWWMYPVLVLGEIATGLSIIDWRFIFLALLAPDFYILVNVLIRIYVGSDPDNVGDDQNDFMTFTQQNYPTLVWEISFWLYKWTRPVNFGCFMMDGDDEDDAATKKTFQLWMAHPSRVNTAPIVGALRWYFRPKTGAPPMAQIWERTLRKIGLV